MARRRWTAAGAAIGAALAVAWSVTAGPFVPQPPVRAPDGAWFEPPNTGASAVVWAVGNGADGSEASKRVARVVEADGPDVVLYLGDIYASSLVRRLLLGEGTAHDFEASYDPVYGDLAERTAPTPGNHEWHQRGRGYEPYWRRVHGEAPPAWYAFEVAGWQVLSLNSEAPHDRDSRQVAWLEEQVSGGGTCRLAFWHEARYSAARTGGDQSDLNPMWDALAGHATIVITAHDHALQRFERIDGITSFVIGAGGHGHHALDEDDPRLAFGDDERYGALRLELTPGSARWQVIDDEGYTLDRGRRGCDAG
jgi:hypothetical protein